MVPHNRKIIYQRLWFVCLLLVIAGDTRVIGDETLSFAACFNTLGIIKAENGMLDSARIYFDSAAFYAPEHPAILENIGNCYACEGNFEKAVEYYEHSYGFD
ncbi:MAG: tetratricopeptide repeat protein, partial [Candidatus Zixiibacteriota bacterium]